MAVQLLLPLLFLFRTSSAWQFVNGTWLLASGGGPPSREADDVVSAASAATAALHTLNFSSGVNMDQPVIITCFTSSLLDLYRNFVCHLDELELTAQHIVYALDDITFETLAEEGAPVVLASSALPRLASFSGLPTDQEYIHGTHSFARLTYRKLHVLTHAARALQEHGFFYTDVDVVFLHNPLEHLDVALDMQFASDYRVAPAYEYTPKKLDNSGNDDLEYLCTGVFYGRGKVALHVLRAAIAFGERKVNAGRDDQLAVNAVLADPNILPSGARIGTFDGLAFTNGYTFFHRHIPQRMSFDPVAVHANYILGKRSKRQQMMLHGLWKWRPKSRKCARLLVPSKNSSLRLKNTRVVNVANRGDDYHAPSPDGNASLDRETWLVLTCADSASILANFHAHILKQLHDAASTSIALPVVRLCSFQITESDRVGNQVRLSREQSIRCHAKGGKDEPSWSTLAMNTLNNDRSWRRAAHGSAMICRKLQLLALDALLTASPAEAAVGGVLWADASTLFVRHPLLPVVRCLNRQHLDVAVCSGWEPRSVLGSLRRQSSSNDTIHHSLREAVSTARALRQFEPPSPRIDASSVLYMKINGKTRAIFARARQHLADIISIDAVFDVELGDSDCFGSANRNDTMPPGVNASRIIVPCERAHASSNRISWGMLDPLLFVDARHLQLAKDMAVPIHAVLFTSTPKSQSGKLHAPLDQTGRMLVANMWRPTQEQEDLDWVRQWHLFEDNAALLGVSIREKEDRVIREQLRKSTKWNTFHHACVVSNRLSSAAVPLLVLLGQALRIRHRMVHFMGGSCKDSGRDLIQYQHRCIIARRFLANRVADHQFMFHGVSSPPPSSGSRLGVASTMTRADLTTLLAETTLLYPFIKCEITIVVQEGSDGGSTEQIVQKALETGLATADGDIIALEIATPKGEREAEADLH